MKAYINSDKTIRLVSETETEAVMLQKFRNNGDENGYRCVGSGTSYGEVMTTTVWIEAQ